MHYEYSKIEGTSTKMLQMTGKSKMRELLYQQNLTSLLVWKSSTPETI
jgi:hypothetical protein